MLIAVFKKLTLLSNIVMIFTWLNKFPVDEANLDKCPKAESLHLLLKEVWVFFLVFVLFWDYFNSHGLQRCSLHHPRWEPFFVDSNMREVCLSWLDILQNQSVSEYQATLPVEYKLNQTYASSHALLCSLLIHVQTLLALDN